MNDAGLAESIVRMRQRAGELRTTADTAAYRAADLIENAADRAATALAARQQQDQSFVEPAEGRS